MGFIIAKDTTNHYNVLWNDNLDAQGSVKTVTDEFFNVEDNAYIGWAPEANDATFHIKPTDAYGIVTYVERLNNIGDAKGTGTPLTWTAPDGSAYSHGEALVQSSEILSIPNGGDDPQYYLVEVDAQSQKVGATGTYRLIVNRKDANVEVQYVKITENGQASTVNNLTRDNDTANFIAKDNSFDLEIQTDTTIGMGKVVEFKGTPLNVSDITDDYKQTPYTLSISAGANETVKFQVPQRFSLQFIYLEID